MQNHIEVQVNSKSTTLGKLNNITMTATTEDEPQSYQLASSPRIAEISSSAKQYHTVQCQHIPGQHFHGILERDCTRFCFPNSKPIEKRGCTNILSLHGMAKDILRASMLDSRSQHHPKLSQLNENHGSNSKHINDEKQ